MRPRRSLRLRSAVVARQPARAPSVIQSRAARVPPTLMPGGALTHTMPGTGAQHVSVRTRAASAPFATARAIITRHPVRESPLQFTCTGWPEFSGRAVGGKDELGASRLGGLLALRRSVLAHGHNVLREHGTVSIRTPRRPHCARSSDEYRSARECFVSFLRHHTRECCGCALATAADVARALYAGLPVGTAGLPGAQCA